MANNRILPIIGIVVVVLILMGVFVMGIYNGEVSRNQTVDAQWGNVETEYQKRFDLVPQLVNVVKGAANFEQETLVQLSELRTQWQTQTETNEKIATANQFESTLSKLLLVAENYPVLQANEQFQTLQIQLEGIENRISVERKKYNDTAREYNTYIQVFPNAFFLGGKEAKEYFESAPGSENAPEVPSDFTN